MSAKKWLLIAGVIIAAALAIVLLLPEQAKPPEIVQNGTSGAVEFGKAGDYGYVTFAYNGSGKVSLISLSEPPKSRIIVLNKDFLDTERYPYFISALGELGQKGFSINETGSIGNPANSIIIIPSGAMPADVLARLDNLSASNQLIYIGKADLVFSGNLLRSDWYANISNYSKSRIIVIEKTLEEFYSEKNYSIFDRIESNAWAAENSADFAYSGEGKKTVFISLKNGSWLRMLPLADSRKLSGLPAKMSGSGEIFPWEKAQVTIQLNYSTGTALYSVEKDGNVTQSGELGRVRGEEAFFLTLAFPSSGDYLVRVSDQNGTLGAKRVHVKNLTVSLARAYGNSYEFDVLLDGAPLQTAPATIGLNHSNNTVEREVKDGKLQVQANLRQGENVFVISLFGQKNLIAYSNTQEDLLAFYAKYLSPGIAVVVVFYIGMRLNRKPVYRIRVPESVAGKNTEVRLAQGQIISALEETERRFGWKDVPLSAREIGLGLKALTGGMEVNEGNVEAVMKKLEERGAVKSHMGLYGLAEWGNPKRNALKRAIRDKLVQNGAEFTETLQGFECEEKQIVLDPEKAMREAITVFEDREELRAYVSSLGEKRLARLEIKIKNGMLRLATLDELDELI